MDQIESLHTEEGIVETMIYFGFPDNTTISTTTPPSDTSDIWLATIPQDTVAVDTALQLASGMAANNMPHLCTTDLNLIYGFTNTPVVKYYNSSTSSWKNVDNSVIQDWIIPYVTADQHLVIRQAAKVVKLDTRLTVR